MNTSITNTDLLTKFFKSYPRINADNPTSYLLSSNCGTTQSAQMVKVCHALLKYERPGKYDYLLTAVPNSSPDAIAYLTMLINGPFRSVSDLISLAQHPDYELWYLKCSNLDKWPANLLYNFCIASRVPIEYKGILKYWAGLVAEGFDGTLAFLIAQSNGGQKLTGAERQWNYSNHMWADASSDWRRVLAGNPTSLAATYATSPASCSPCNIIWGKSDDYKKLRYLSDEAVAEYFDMVPVKVVPEPDAVTILYLDIEADPVPLMAWHGAPPMANPGIQVVVNEDAIIGNQPNQVIFDDDFDEDDFPDEFDEDMDDDDD